MATRTFSQSGTYSVSLVGDPVGVEGIALRCVGSGFTGGITLKQNTAPPGSAAVLVDVPYRLLNSDAAVDAGTAITGDSTVIVSDVGYDLYAVVTVTAGSMAVKVTPANDGLNNRALQTAREDGGYSNAGQQSFPGQVASALADLLGQSLDVRAFGARGDGVTDDTTAIQAADAAAGVGGAVLAPSGTYRITSNITLVAGWTFPNGSSLSPGAGITVTMNGPIANSGDRVASEDADGWVVLNGRVNGAITKTQVVPLDRRVDYYAFGDSYTAGTGASSTAHNYVQILGQSIESFIENRGIGARGVYRMWREMCVYLPITLRNASLVTAMASLNDIRKGGPDPKTMRKVENVHRALVALALADIVLAADNAAVTAAGSWTVPSLVGDGLRTKAGTVDVAGNALQAVAGSTLSYTFTSDTLVIWPWLSDGVTYNYGPATITIDGVLWETFDPNNQTDGIGDPDNDNGRVPGALVYTGLGSGSHTVVIAPTDATLPFVVDCVGYLRPPENAQPVIVAGPPYLMAATYGSSAPYNLATPALITQGNAVIQSVCEEFTPWPVKFFRVSDYFDKQNDSDGLHPDDAGYRQIAAGFLAQIAPTIKSIYRGVGSQSTAIGLDAQATGIGSIGVGEGAVASANQAAAIGLNSLASGSGAHAIGVGALADGVAATAVGYTADAGGANAVAVGNGANAAGSGATALGATASAGHNNAVAVGIGATTTKANQVMLGTAAEEASVPGTLRVYAGPIQLTDGITAPATVAGVAQIYVDTADGDLKVKFGDGTVKTIVVDT